jgi:Glycosyl hydrolase family 95 catalytic domain/Glycoside hydrolase family 95, C-terminal domain
VFHSNARQGSGGPSASTLAGRATSAVNGLTTTDMTDLRNGHRDFWKNFWLQSFIQTNDPTMNAYWYGSLYAMGSASRPGKVLADMNGPWVINDFTQFPRYWYNYNVQAPFYGVASANHPELLQPYNVQQAAEQQWQINWTAQSGGYKGEMWQRSMAPFHQFMPTPAPAAVAGSKHNRWTDQKSNGFFAAVPSIFYYDYTQDQTFLKNQLYPNMKAVDAFFRDYLTTSGSRLVMAHSSAHEASDDLNPNLDIGFIIRTENFLIQTSQKLGVDANMIPVWQNTLAKLAKMPTGTVNGKTVYLMAENINGSTSTSATFNPGDQPINMEGGVFPGENIYVGGDPTQLQIAINTLQQMNSWGVTSGENMGNGFPKEFPIAARAGWPAADLESKFDAAIKKQWRSTNLTVAQSGGGIETAGSIEAVDSMLMQSVSGTIRLFGDADWPTSKNASFTRLRAKGAFVVTAAISAGKVSPVTLSSDVGGTVKIKNPWSSGTVSVTTAAGTAVPFTSSGGVISFATTAGTTYQVTSTSAAKLAAYRQPLGGLSAAPLFLGFGFAMAAAYLAGSRRRPRADQPA